MRRVIRALISLYPKAWRERYENEYIALLDQMQPSWRTLFDVLGGALKMQTKTWTHWKIVPLFAIAGVVVAAVYSLTMPNHYRSTAVIKLADPARQIETVLSRGGLTQLINEENLYQSERAHIPIEDVIQTMKENIAITSAGRDTLAISFTSESAVQATRMTERLAYEFNDANTWALLDAPSLPVLSNPRRSRIVVMGAIVGFIVGVLFAPFNGLRIWKTAAVLGTAGTILFAASSYLLPDRYSSVVVLRYSGSDAALREAVDMATSPANLQRFASLFGVFSDDPHPARRLREHLHIEPLPSTHAVFLKSDYTDRYKAQRVVQRVAYQMMDTPGASLEMIDPASLPFNPYFPNRVNVAVIGLTLGLLVATILGIRERRQIHA